jgi:hypothetical protein
MKEQEDIMHAAGYVTIREAAEACGLTVGTIHRRVTNGDFEGARAGHQWYVLVRSLVENFADAPPILSRIYSLGVDVKDPMPTPKPKANGPRKAVSRGR